MRTTNSRYYRHRQQNNWYYGTSVSGPKRWHKAVTSRSRYGFRNPNAISHYIPNEDLMNHNVRKSFVLPCGRTVAESWSALRKSWLGFKIALSNDDRELMRHYASFITKVELEMGVQITHFDSDILDAQEVSEIAGRCFYKKVDEVDDDGSTVEEEGPDYDSIMDDARSKVNGEAEKVAPPRQHIFDKSNNPCWFLPREREYTKKENKMQSKMTWKLTGHLEQSRGFSIPANASKTIESDTCRYKHPLYNNESQSGYKIEGREPQETADENKSCHYIHPGKSERSDYPEKNELHEEISPKDNQNENRSHGRRSCFYKHGG